jgi:hypothetical protein
VYSVTCSGGSKTEMIYRAYNLDDGIAAFSDTPILLQLQQVSPMTSVSIDTVCA